MAIRPTPQPSVPVKEHLLAIVRTLTEMVREEGVIYANEEECAFFRSLPQQSQEPPKQSTAPQVLKKKIEIEEPPPASTPFAPAAPPAPAAKAPEPPKELAKPPQPDADYAYFQKIFAKIAPGYPLLQEAPNDAKARSVSERWKTKNQAAAFSLLSFSEPKAHRALLQNLTIALETVFGDARLIDSVPIEQEKQWESFLSAPQLKLVIICDYALWQQPSLLTFFREVPSKSERFLLNAPLFLLPDLSLYLKDPLLKRSLWKALCQKIS